MAGGGGGSPLQTIGQQTQSAINSAKKAGFSGLPLVIIVAIARAESGLDPKARNTNSDGSIDRGILQFNNKYHPEVTDSCADSPDCAFQAAYRVSNQGRNFTAWETYKSKKYAAFLSSIGNMAGVTIPANLLKDQEQAQNDNVPIVGPVINTVKGGVDVLTQIGQVLSVLGNPTTWVRVGLFLAALIIIFIGFTLIANGPPDLSGLSKLAGQEKE